MVQDLGIATLLEHSFETIEDLEAVVEEVTEPSLDRYVRGARQAIASFVDGREIAAQSTATMLLTHIAHEITSARRLRDVKNELAEFDPHTIAYDHFRSAAVFSTIGEVTLGIPYFPGDPVPTDYSRHASAHTLSVDQYNDGNALISLLNAVALLREVQDLHDRTQTTQANRNRSSTHAKGRFSVGELDYNLHGFVNPLLLQGSPTPLVRVAAF